MQSFTFHLQIIGFSKSTRQLKSLILEKREADIPFSPSKSQYAKFLFIAFLAPFLHTDGHPLVTSLFVIPAPVHELKPFLQTFLFISIFYRREVLCSLSVPVRVSCGKSGRILVTRRCPSPIFLAVRLQVAEGRVVVGTNTTYLSNTVNEMFGCNLKSLINWYRVQYAKDVLRRGICRLKDIPFVCGFASKSTFYASFKRCEGITPNHYVSTCKESCD